MQMSSNSVMQRFAEACAKQRVSHPTVVPVRPCASVRVNTFVIFTEQLMTLIEATENAEAGIRRMRAVPLKVCNSCC